MNSTKFLEWESLTTLVNCYLKSNAFTETILIWIQSYPSFIGEYMINKQQPTSSLLRSSPIHLIYVGVKQEIQLACLDGI